MYIVVCLGETKLIQGHGDQGESYTPESYRFEALLYVKRTNSPSPVLSSYDDAPNPAFPRALEKASVEAWQIGTYVAPPFNDSDHPEIPPIGLSFRWTGCHTSKSCGHVTAYHIVITFQKRIIVITESSHGREHHVEQIEEVNFGQTVVLSGNSEEIGSEGEAQNQSFMKTCFRPSIESEMKIMIKGNERHHVF
ncbi:hypothetical protein ARMSODRAFT_978477 [Armillaria solidipes]|uniref:Uncharacterized protein n=1 Tax=Armillaria solidipes TaxID=1076256 RepID=A0A2H3B6S0_9AGAR|nr:hypothetical protein ARMSODRAFT_978477 [Armillaria solidipes]